jgi:transposase
MSPETAWRKLAAGRRRYSRPSPSAVRRHSKWEQPGTQCRYAGRARQKICREDLFSAFRHAKAGQIEVEVHFGIVELRVRFRDNGSGIDPAILREGSAVGHYGLSGMRERCSKIRSSLELWSRPGAGTEIDGRVPAADRAQVGELARQVQQITGEQVGLAYVDQGYTGEAAEEAAAEHGIQLEVVKHTEAKRGFVLLPRRWVVERSFAWAARFRRLARDYERLATTLGAFHFLAFACLMIAHLFRLLA